ncbi:folate-binding protein [Beijerinckiaceae bacterium]|nr:folate-binding protein [Beijerinckiaceae bacterium]
MEEGQCLLNDRGIIRMSGGETSKFLHRVITNSVLSIPEGESRYSGLLTAQGKLIIDFFVVPLPEGPEAGFLLDCPREYAADLVKRLNLHKMRAKIEIEDQSETLGVAAIFEGEAPGGVGGIVYRDMRAPGMGLRMIAPRETLLKLMGADATRYEAHRVAQGVPKGGVDFAYGDTFVHDANLDLLNGVDFKKGCYVGQEVVARVHFRKSARKRIVKIHFNGAAQATGTPITAGETPIGQVGSTAGDEGLAMVRLDRLEDARTAGAVTMAEGVPLEIVLPSYLSN